MPAGLHFRTREAAKCSGSRRRYPRTSAVLGGILYNCFCLPRAYRVTHRVINMDAQRVRIRVLACFAAVSITVPAIAQTSTPAASVSSSVSSALSRIRIGNFGRVNDHYFRGSQPKGSDFRDLAAFGVKTVIDLQQDGPSNE